MTNHPGRKRGDDEEAHGAEELAAAVPAVQEMADEMHAQMPPGSTPNGVPPGLKQDPVILAAKAVAQALGEHLPNMLFQAMTAALSQSVVQAATQQHLCSACLIERIRWEGAHRAEMEAAMTAAAAASPEVPQPDLTPHLPEALRPGAPRGMPGVGQSVTTFQGAEMCPVHVAQAAGVQPGRSPLLVANAAMSPAMLGQLAGRGLAVLLQDLARRPVQPVRVMLPGVLRVELGDDQPRGHELPGPHQVSGDRDRVAA